MIIFPAIDLKDGVCVRLMQGDPERRTVYGTDPVAVARRWQAEGAEWLHIVDLDGAFASNPKNRRVILEIAAALDIPIQVGGGIRTLEVIEGYLEAGIARVILGTIACTEPDFLALACDRFPDRIALGLDARDGKAAVRGWRETTSIEVLTLAAAVQQLALTAIIYTDIQRDGMQSGVNLEATRRLLEATAIPVIASGGVAGIDDLTALLPLVPLGLAGVITGKALYTGALTLKDALRVAKAGPDRPV